MQLRLGHFPFDQTSDKTNEYHHAMFATRSICATCRSRLASSASRHTIVRTATRSQPSSTVAAAPEASSSATAAASGSSTRNAASKPPSSKPGSFKKGGANKRRALDLFESTVSAAQQVEREHKLDFNGLFDLARRIEDVLSKEHAGRISNADATKQCHAIVRDILAIERQSGGARLPQFVYTTATRAVRKVLDAKATNFSDEGLPSAVELCRIIDQLGMKSPGRLDPFILLLRRLVEDMPGSDPHTDQRRFDEALMKDLQVCWEDLSSSRRSPRPETPGGNRARKHRRQQDPLGLLRANFPLLATHAHNELVVALVASHVVLSDPRSLDITSPESFQGLREDLATLVKSVDKARLGPAFANYPLLGEYVLPRATWSTTFVPDQDQGPPASSERPNAKPAGSAISYAGWHKRLNSLFKSNDVLGLREAWADLTQPSNDPQRATRLRSCPELFDFIIHQCCRKQGPGGEEYRDLNGAVMDYMKDIGLQPTVRTYTGMIEGWKISKRAQHIDMLWKQIINTGTKLDEHIWSSRISACGALGKPEDGLKALEEMSRTWQDAVEAGVGDQAVKPGIASVNAAASGLLRAERLDAVQTVLAWAGAQGIEPDIYTYNLLLSHCLKCGLMEEADRIFASMKATNIVPDGATFTIILETALAEIRSQPPEVQRATIVRVFGEMAACGIEPNQETYAKMLHVLMRAGDAARAPVDAVLAHLQGSGLQPSAQICTILFEYHFSRRPRDWDAIRDLIADRRSRTRVLTDRVFWETVMRHFQEAGETAAALEIFYDMDEWGIWVTLPALEPMLRSLVAAKRWEDAERLVATVRAQARPAAAGDPDGRYWRHAFWAVARDHGLLNEELSQA